MILGSLKNVRVIRLPRRDAWLFFQIHPGDRRLKLAPRIGGMKNCPYWGDRTSSKSNGNLEGFLPFNSLGCV